MPVNPISPYDTAQTALTDAIIFSNDAGGPNGLSGNILNPATNPAVLPAFQERYRYLQQRLISCGVDTFTKEAVIFALPPTASSNPRVRMLLTYNGYWNGQEWIGPNITAPAYAGGTTYAAGQTVVSVGIYYISLVNSNTGNTPATSPTFWQAFTNVNLSAPTWSAVTTYTQGQTVEYGGNYWVAQPNAGTNLAIEPDTSSLYWAPFSAIGPCLPTDLIKPLELWECQTGSNGWVPMKQQPDCITANLIQPRFQQWVFSNEKLVLPGASFTNDIRMKYVAVAPDIVTFDSIIYPRQCSTALALLVLDQLSGARGGPMSTTFKARAEEAISQIVNQTVRKQAYSSIVRRPYKSRLGGIWGGRSGV